MDYYLSNKRIKKELLDFENLLKLYRYILIKITDDYDCCIKLKFNIEHYLILF